MEKCSYGLISGDECHKKTYSKECKLKLINEFDSEQRELIYWRSGLSVINLNAKVCSHHEYWLLNQFEIQKKKCCDPFQNHKKAVKGISPRHSICELHHFLFIRIIFIRMTT